MGTAYFGISKLRERERERERDELTEPIAVIGIWLKQWDCKVTQPTPIAGGRVFRRKNLQFSTG